MLNGPHREWLTPHDSVSSTILMFHHFFRYMEGMSGAFRSGIPWNSTWSPGFQRGWLQETINGWAQSPYFEIPNQSINYKLWYCWYPLSLVSLKIHENTPQKKKTDIESKTGMSNDSKVRAKSPSTSNNIFQWFHVRFQCFDYFIVQSFRYGSNNHQVWYDQPPKIDWIIPNMIYIVINYGW